MRLPACLTLAFFATHAEDQNPLQYLPQPQSMELYKDVTIPLANADMLRVSEADLRLEATHPLTWMVSLSA